VQTSFGDFDKPRHGTVGTVTESLSARVEVVFSDPGHGGIRIDDRGGFAANAIPFAKRRDVRSGLDHPSSELMAQRDRIIYRPAMKSGPLMQVATADTDGGDLHEGIGGPNLWDINFPEFHGHGFLGKVNDGWLFGHGDHASKWTKCDGFWATLCVELDRRTIGDVDPHVHVWVAAEVPDETWPFESPIVPDLVPSGVFVGVESQMEFLKSTLGFQAS